MLGLDIVVDVADLGDIPLTGADAGSACVIPGSIAYVSSWLTSAMPLLPMANIDCVFGERSHLPSRG